MDDVFRRLREGLGADLAEFAFDGFWCVPAHVYLHYESGTADEEWSFTLHGFSPVGRVASSGCRGPAR